MHRNKSSADLLPTFSKKAKALNFDYVKRKNYFVTVPGEVGIHF